MIQHHYPGEDAKDANDYLQALQGSVKENADDTQDAFDQ
jgi:hypothetical protein